MSYRLSFTGPASPDIHHLLTALEHRLNGQVSMSLANEDPPASVTEVSIKKCTNGQLQPCPDNDPRGPWLLVGQGTGLLITIVALSFAAGFGVAMMLVFTRLKRQ